MKQDPVHEVILFGAPGLKIMSSSKNLTTTSDASVMVACTTAIKRLRFPKVASGKGPSTSMKYISYKLVVGSRRFIRYSETGRESCHWLQLCTYY